jgi:exonuclease SbcC
MKIKTLALAGFGPYLGEQRVDFEDFDDDGIFLITGKTGAGKSSILDAICYALYGSIPRYEGSQQKLRSDHCAPEDPTFVELVFSVDGVDYRVRRTPEYEQPKKRGTGLTRVAPTAELFRRVGDDWEGLSARPVDVGKELVELVRLSKDQFLQVILLAQNRFQEFLRSSNDDRLAVLRSLFGTQRFLGYETALVERRKLLEEKVADSLAATGRQIENLARILELEEIPQQPDLAWFDSGLSDLRSRHSLAQDDAVRTDAALSAAEAEHRRLGELRGLQLRQAAATESLAKLMALNDSIAADRLHLATAGRAAAVWAHVTARKDADAALRSSRAALDEARAAYEPHGPSDIAAGALAAAMEEDTRRLGALEEALAEESGLRALDAEVVVATERLSAAEKLVAAASESVAELPGRIDVATEGLGEARIAAAGHGGAVAEVERLAAASEAAVLAARLGEESTAAQIVEAGAGAAHATAATRHHALMEQRLAGHAAELAAELVEGEPCAVCGSPHHPAPATGEAAPITQEHIDAARAEVDDRRAELDDATAAREAVATRLAEAVTRADGRTATQLEERLEDANAALALALAAGARALTLEQDIASLRSELELARATLGDLGAAREAAATALAESRSRRDAAEQRVQTQRNGFDSVAERAAALSAALDSARDLGVALDDTRSAETALLTATTALTAQLAEHDFSTEEEAVAARLSSAQTEALDFRIRRHDEGIAIARATLAEPELAALPEEAVDVDAARERVTIARGERDRALGWQTTLAERVTEAARVVGEARTGLAASSLLLAEFEQLRELSNVVQGKSPNTKLMSLETYVLAAQLEQIVSAANARLAVMTGGRFTLEHDDSIQYRKTASGLGLAILDGHTGRSRATHSLSGGETFLASLALALGLAEVVTNQAGGIRLDTLFIDEGFGSLDDETLEIAMSTLDGLRAGGRTIGLISHVGSMREQIVGKLQVVVTPRGDSTIVSPRPASSPDR